jgi:hypothetical protein
MQSSKTSIRYDFWAMAGHATDAMIARLPNARNAVDHQLDWIHSARVTVHLWHCFGETIRHRLFSSSDDNGKRVTRILVR